MKINWKQLFCFHKNVHWTHYKLHREENSPQKVFSEVGRLEVSTCLRCARKDFRIDLDFGKLTK